MVCSDVGQLLRPAVAVTLVLTALLSSTPTVAGSPLHHHTDSFSVLEKRPYKNFLRFGRGDDAAAGSANPADAVYDSLDGANALDMALADVWAAKRAANRNFLRFGRGFNPKNFIRFGRASGTRARNFLRFGRDLSSSETGLQQHFPKGLTSNQDDFNSGSAAANNRITSSDATAQEASPRSKRSAVLSTSGDDDSTGVTSDTKEAEKNLNFRSKRAVPNLFALLNSPNGGDWLPDNDDMAGFSYGDGTSDEEEALTPTLIQDIQKRAFPRSFLRFGREPSDLQFIRFGKRGSGEHDSGSGSESMEGSSGRFHGTGESALGSANQFERILRARNNLNFLRYGR